MNRWIDKSILCLVLILFFQKLPAQRGGDSLLLKNKRAEKINMEAGDLPEDRLPSPTIFLRWQRNAFMVSTVCLVIFAVLVIQRNMRTANLLRQEVTRLEGMNHSKDELLSVVSHDLRSAVHTLHINVSRLKTMLQQEGTAEALRQAEHTEQLTLSTQSLLNNLLYWTLSQTGQVNIQPESIAVRGLVRHVCDDLGMLAAAKRIDLQQSVLHDLHFNGDLNTIRIALRNLLDNALKYTPAEGQIAIAAVQEGDYCRITITDTGIGMDEETLQAVLLNTYNRVQEDAYGRRSTGIGLRLVRTMVEKNAGQLTIWSRKGTGTSVTVRLPAS